MCAGSGFLNANGQAATSNNTEAARGGEFGTDHASINDAAERRVLADLEIRARVGGHRPGWRVTDEGKAHHARMNDEYAKLDDERESAWKNVSTFEVTPPAEMERITPPPSEDNRTLDQKVADHRRIMDAEYQNYEAQIGSAWRKI